jgi:cyclopropane fatty-acyl-phospholipid synthase-like methyltransferase
MHIGYYDHVANPGNPRTKWDEAVVALTHRMCDTSGVNKDSRVLDFGCGVGENSFDIADSYGCELSAGIDITGDYIVRANVEAKSRGFGSQCVFFAGSILDLPESVYGYAPYTHVLSQECIYHVAAHFEEAVVSAGAVLETGGVFANCDFFRSDSGPDDKALGHFYKRLKLDYLVSMTECCEVLTSNGFEIVSVEDWSGHAVEGYKELEAAAKQAGVISDDGVPLAEHYNETWHAFERRSLLMPYVIARKR